MARKIQSSLLTALLLFITLWPSYGATVSSVSAQKGYVQRAQAQIDVLAAGLRKAERHLNRLDKDMRQECEETLKRLRRKERLARANLKEIRKAPLDRWRSLRPKEDALLIHLQKSYQHLVNRYLR
jgi:hypothetical protein